MLSAAAFAVLGVLLLAGVTAGFSGALRTVGVTHAAASGPRVASGAVGTSLGKQPPYLQRLSMADDPEDGFVLAFGGENPVGVATGFTLAYSGGTWTNLTPDLSVAPPPRAGASMMYDPVDQQVILFGGCQTSSCDPGFSDTWAFYGDSWHDITTTVGTPPSPRGYAVMVWDGADGYGLLFGGEAGTTTSTHYFGDTWEFSHDRWSNITGNISGPSPSPRAGAAIASLPTGAVVLFGGHGGPNSIGDTWSYQSDTWSNLTSTAGAGPSPRTLAMFAADPPEGDLFLLGGVSGAGYLHDAWTFQTGEWSPGPPASTAVGVFGAGFVYDSEDGYLLLYGGAIDENGGTGTTNAYWSYAAGGWHQFNPPPPTPIDWTALLPVLILLVILPVELVILRRREARRLAELSALMPEVPSAAIRWVPTAPPSVLGYNRRRSAAIMYGILVPAGVFITWTTVYGTPSATGANDLIFLGLIWVLLLVLPSMVLLARRPMDTRAVGISDLGVTVRRSKQEVRIPWEYLQPPTTNPKGPWVYFHFSVPGRQPLARGFSATHDQARAILAHPRAGGWTVPPPVRETLGIPPSLSLGTGSPLASATTLGFPPPGVPVPHTESAPLAGGGPIAPPAPRPAAAVGPSPASVPRVPQLRRCPRCGALSTVQARFCSRCGQPLA